MRIKYCTVNMLVHEVTVLIGDSESGTLQSIDPDI